MHNKSFFVVILTTVFSFNLYASFETKQSNLKTNSLLKLYDKYVTEVLRVDGDGLIPRMNRKKSWIEISKDLRFQLAKAKTRMEIGRVFARLDAAYTNLHAHIDLSYESFLLI